MNPPTYHDFKKHASFFLKEKIKTARLARPMSHQQNSEEATNGNPGGPDVRALKMISKAAFEVDDYWRIVGILHKRLVKFDKRNWRESYKGLIVLEYLLTHGPESVADEFQREIDVIKEMERFQYIDEKGYNWGVNVRKKSERVVKLLLLKEERDKARKISRGIEGFGSFSLRTSSPQHSSLNSLNRCNSQFNNQTNHDYFVSCQSENGSFKTEIENSSVENSRIQEEKLALNEGAIVKECAAKSKPLLSEEKGEVMGMKMAMEDHHPFDRDTDEHLTTSSLLATA